MSRERLRLDEVFSKYAQDVFRYLWLMTGDRGRAEELTQETFFRALVGSGHFQGKSSVRTWLLAIARHAFLDQLRRTQRHREVLRRLKAALHPQPATPEEIAVARSDWAAVRGALDLLPERQRTMLVLREGRGLPYAQIAEVTGASQAAVRKNISLARAALRKAYARFDSGALPATGRAHRPGGSMREARAGEEAAHAVSGRPQSMGT